MKIFSLGEAVQNIVDSLDRQISEMGEQLCYPFDIEFAIPIQVGSEPCLIFPNSNPHPL